MFEDLEEKLLIVLIGTVAIATVVGLSKGVSLLINKIKSRNNGTTSITTPPRVIMLPPPEGCLPSGGQ